MSRQRYVYPRDRVSHLWAHGGQDRARDASDTFSFSGGSLYSYGSHFVIAHILRGDEYKALNGIVVWNDDSYSNTTSKHQWIARRALTGQQSANALHVPSFNAEDVRNMTQDLAAKKLPQAMTDRLLSVVRTRIQSLASMRHGSGPFNGALHDARTYQASAMRLYAHAGRKYPLPMLPESNNDVPASKPERAAFILTYSRAAIQADYIKALAEANRYLQQAQNADMSGSIYGERAAVNGTYDTAQRAERASSDAARFYALLHEGRKSRAVQALQKTITPILADFAARKLAAEHAETAQRLDHALRGFYRLMRQRIDPSERAARMPGYPSKMLDEVRSLSLPVDDPRSIMAHRLQRMDDARCARRAKENAIQAFAAARSYDEGPRAWPGDAKRNYVQGMDYVTQMRRYAPRMFDWLTKDLHDDIVHAQQRLLVIDAEAKAAEAARIAAWIAGESEVKPRYEAGTYARIKNGQIETNRGAVVPVEHACRLARVFDRIVSAGGKEWRDGAGPMVGHYRVNVIGADSSLVIGCHAFDPAEARRLRDLLQSCAECQSEWDLRK